MGTTVLSAVEKIGRIPDAYFQAVGSGTGAIAAWENACRLEKDGRFGKNNMRVYCVQNAPYTLMYDSWKAGSRELVPITPEDSRKNAEIILERATQVLTIPESTLNFEEDKTYVYVLTDSTQGHQKFQKKEVTTGLSNGVNIQVKSGVKAGEKLRGIEIIKE